MVVRQLIAKIYEVILKIKEQLVNWLLNDITLREVRINKLVDKGNTAYVDYLDLDHQSSDPGSPTESLVWYNSTDHVLRYRNDSETIDVTGGISPTGDEYYESSPGEGIPSVTFGDGERVICAFTSDSSFALNVVIKVPGRSTFKRIYSWEADGYMRIFNDYGYVPIDIVGDGSNSGIETSAYVDDVSYWYNEGEGCYDTIVNYGTLASGTSIVLGTGNAPVGVYGTSAFMDNVRIQIRMNESNWKDTALNDELRFNGIDNYWALLPQKPISDGTNVRIYHIGGTNVSYFHYIYRSWE